MRGRARSQAGKRKSRAGEAALDVTIVGPGRVGQAIGNLLAAAGVSIRCVAARQKNAARHAVQFIGSGVAANLDDPELAGASVILLTVSDRALDPLARLLAKIRSDWHGRVVLHTCGTLPASVLRPLKRRGAAVGSLHPFQTVPTPAAGSRNLTSCFWAIEGDRKACQVAMRLARALEGTPFQMGPSGKILYHAGAVLACGAVVALLEQSARLLRRSGVPAEMVRPMLGRFLTETVSNFVKLGGRKALTGPQARGDWATVEKHFRAMRRLTPDVVPVYRELTRAMARLAGRTAPRRLA